MTTRFRVVAALLAFALALGVATITAQQSGDVADAPTDPSWLVKLREAVDVGDGLMLTADETAELVNAVAELERAQVADVAVSGRTVYVIGRGGSVVASTPIPDGAP